MYRYEPGARYFLAVNRATDPLLYDYVVTVSTADLIPGDPTRSRARNTRIVDRGTCALHAIGLVAGRWAIRSILVPTAAEIRIPDRWTLRRPGTSAEEIAMTEANAHPASIVESTVLPFEREQRAAKRYSGY